MDLLYSHAMSDSAGMIRRAILREALKSAPFEGWTPALLSHASETAGYEPLMHKRVFPGGVVEALDFFIAEADRQMLESLDKETLAAMKVRERIAALIRTRLERQLAHREAIRRAIAVYLLPGNYPHLLRTLHGTVDAIWRAAGDASTDFNWYTKRFLLAKVYGATLMVWLRDDSEGQKNTWEFLDRRIANVLAVGKTVAQAKAKAEDFGDFLTRQMRKAARP